MDQNFGTEGFIAYCHDILRLPIEYPAPLKQMVRGNQVASLGAKYKELRKVVKSLENYNDFVRIATRNAAARISEIEAALNDIYTKETQAGMAPKITIRSTKKRSQSDGVPNVKTGCKRKYDDGAVFGESTESLFFQVPSHEAKKFKSTDMFGSSIDILPDVKSHLNRIISFEDFITADSMEDILSQLDIENVDDSTVASSRILKWYNQRCAERNGAPTKEDFWIELMTRLMDFARYVDDVAYNKPNKSPEAAEIRTNALITLKPMLELVCGEITPVYMNFMSIAAARHGVWIVVWFLGNVVRLNMDKLKLRNQPLSRSELAMYNIINTFNNIESAEESICDDDGVGCEDESVKKL